MLTEAVSVKNPKQREENGIEGLHPSLGFSTIFF